MESMEVEQYYDGNAEGSSILKWRSCSDEVGDSNDSISAEFDCNICLDAVQDPVVTLCGHLYCWPCIYKWLHCQSVSAEDNDLQQQCPVCKAKVSQDTLVPLFGRGQTKTTRSCKSKATNFGITIPRRPLAYGFDVPRPTPTAGSSRPARNIYDPHVRPSQRYYSESVAYPAPPSLGPNGMTTNMLEPLLGTVGELIHTRVFGTSMGSMLTYHHLAMHASPRVRRQVMEADRSLSRIFLFLLCCALLCLLLF